MKKAEQLVCGPVAQLFSLVGIDVAHHQRHIFLGEVVEACLLRQYAADHLMGDFNAALLIGPLRVTVEHACSTLAISVELDGKRIRKFTSPVRQNDRKQSGKHFMPKQFVKPVEDLCDAPGGVVITDEGKHQRTTPKVDRKKHLAAFASLY